MRPHVIEVLLALCSLAPTALAQTPFSGATEPGIRFPLPQEPKPGTNPPRRMVEGISNALTISWDGRLIMYADSGLPLWQNAPAGARQEGFVFATFDPDAVQLVNGRPDFTGCIGAPHARFAELQIQGAEVVPGVHPGNNYPSRTDYTGPYPYIVGTMGELGLFKVNYLSNNMYPALDLPSGANGENPFRSTLTGTPDPNGAYRTYRAWVTFQDIPVFWNGSAWFGYGAGNTTPFSYYQSGTYPNGVTLNISQPFGQGELIKRNGICKLNIIVDPAAHEVKGVRVLQKWKPFRISTSGWTNPSGMAIPDGLSVPSGSAPEMWADNFEPILTQDGHLMAAKGSPLLVQGTGGTSRVVFYYNTTPFGESGWQGPWEFHHLYLKNSTVLGGSTIAERYPISRRPIRDYDGTILGDTNGNGILTQAEANAAAFEGGYTWLDPDGRFLLYSVDSGGVGMFHPETTLAQDSSNRGQASIVGSVTGWQMWRIDHEAENPSRHLFTAWDQESRTTHLRNASFGFTPGFWDVLQGADGLPLRDDGRLKLQLINSNRLLYYELDLSPYQERDYGFYLPMTEMLDLVMPSVQRVVDVGRTPDLSGKGHFATVEGGQLPCEYFGLPTGVSHGPPRSGAGLYYPASTPGGIEPLGTWNSGNTIQVTSGPGAGYWVPLADWKDGKDFMPPNGLPPYTQPFTGRGYVRDMDSDACWGRVGQAMFFRKSTKVRVSNLGTPPELNPGTTVAGAEQELTASLWVHPLQTRTSNTALFQHNVTITLKPNGTIEATLQAGGLLRSPSGAAPLNQWTHVALTWEDLPGAGSQARLYVNGVEIANGSPLALTYDQLPTGGDILAGCLNDCVSNTNAVLLLDEVALKNNALFGEDVRNLALLPVPVPQWNNTGLPDEPDGYDNLVDGRVPTSNPYDATIAQIGADLFRDVQLSSSKEMSCASCHDPSRAFTENLAVAIGNGGQPLLRNTQTIYNQRFRVEQFWDARAVDLEDQAADPIFEPTEMNLDWNTVDAYLENDPGTSGYNARFAGAPWFATDITETHVRKALATYMRAPTAGASPADQFEAGTASALSPSELRGRALFFGRARCSGCHGGPNFSDGRLWTTGTFRVDGHDDGAYEPNASPITADRARYLGAFKTPSLRELERTGPYFHDGHAATLHDVVAFYNAGGVRQDAQPGYGLLQTGHDIVAEEINHELGLTPGEIDDLVDYLEAITARPTSGGMVDDGPTGLNTPPSVVLTEVIYGKPPGGGPINSVKVTAEVTDDVAEAGAADLDPTSVMDWTLEVEVGGVAHHWSEGTVTSITNGYRISLTVTNPPTPLNLRARAADHHGLWSGWTYP